MADMDSALTTPLEPIVPTFPVKRFTADQYIEMIRVGILTKRDRVELVDGIITEMAPSGPDHNWGVQRLHRLFRPAEDKYYVFVQGTVVIGESQVFDPDVAFVKLSAAIDNPPRHPQSDEIDLIVEIADSSITQDREVKAAAYAAADIQEYWVVDLYRRLIWVHRDQSGRVYRTITSVDKHSSVCPLAYPSLSIRVQDFLFD